MKRRVFIAALAGVSASAWPTALMAQPASGVRRLGILMGIANDATGHALLAAFEQRLRDLGWTASGNIRVDYRWGAGDAEKAGKLANELVELQPDVIFCQTTQSLVALRRATRIIPIIFVQVSDPVGSGFVRRLAHPAGNATGFTNFKSSMGSKWLELLKEIVPSAARIRAPVQPSVVSSHCLRILFASVREASRQLGVEAFSVPVHNAGEIEQAIDGLTGKPNAALIVLPDTFNIVHTD